MEEKEKKKKKKKKRKLSPFYGYQEGIMAMHTLILTWCGGIEGKGATLLIGLLGCGGLLVQCSWAV